MSERTMISLRVKADDLGEIDRRAEMAQLSRTEYIVRCALGVLSDPRAADGRLEEVERRLGRLEEIAFSQ